MPLCVDRERITVIRGREEQDLGDEMVVCQGCQGDHDMRAWADGYYGEKERQAHLAGGAAYIRQRRRLGLASHRECPTCEGLGRYVTETRDTCGCGPRAAWETCMLCGGEGLVRMGPLTWATMSAGDSQSKGPPARSGQVEHRRMQ
jgi:hypothetical protein